jgi:hypothetical protein
MASDLSIDECIELLDRMRQRYIAISPYLTLEKSIKNDNAQEAKLHGSKATSRRNEVAWSHPGLPKSALGRIA